MATANNKMLALEELDDETLDRLRAQFDQLARKAGKEEGKSENDPDGYESLSPSAST